MTEDIKRPRFIAHCRKQEPKEQSLEDHLVGVSRLAAEFAAKIGLREQGELLGLLHDFGKYSADIRRYIRRDSVTTTIEFGGGR